MTLNETIGMRVKQLRERVNMTQGGFAKEVGSSAAYISQIEKGRRGGKKILEKMAERWGLFSLNYFYTEEKPAEIQGTLHITDEAGMYPVLSWDEASTGRGKAVGVNVFGLRIIDDTMMPDFRAGDVIMVSKNIPPVTGKVILTKIRDNEQAEVRRILYEENRVVLKSLCKGKADEIFTGKGRKKFIIIGTVVKLVRYV